MPYTIPNSTSACWAMGRVSSAHSGRLMFRPQFQVLRAIIRLITVPVVDLFMGRKWPIQHALHNNAVLEAPALGPRTDLLPNIPLSIKPCCTQLRSLARRWTPTNPIPITATHLNLSSPTLLGGERACFYGTRTGAVFQPRYRWCERRTALRTWPGLRRSPISWADFPGPEPGSARDRAALLALVVATKRLLAFGTNCIGKGTGTAQPNLALRLARAG
jgi:hypothetical protein